MKTRNGPEARSNASAGWIRPATRGSMPSRYAAVKVGAMTKADRNSARLTITAFGGAVWVPMAERKGQGLGFGCRRRCDGEERNRARGGDEARRPCRFRRPDGARPRLIRAGHDQPGTVRRG